MSLCSSDSCPGTHVCFFFLAAFGLKFCLLSFAHRSFVLQHGDGSCCPPGIRDISAEQEQHTYAVPSFLWTLLFSPSEEAVCTRRPDQTDDTAWHLV